MIFECRNMKKWTCVFVGTGLCVFILGFMTNFLHIHPRQYITENERHYIPRPEEFKVLQESLKDESFMKKIVYNRVGKCGSRSMLSLISRLSKLNDFVFHPSPISNQTKLTLAELVEEAKIVNNLPSFSIYSRHIHYIEFIKFGMIPPLYINMIRDPIERFSSQYHFARYGDNNRAEGRRIAPWKEGEKDMNINDCILNSEHECVGDKLFYIIPYFCGQDIICQKPSKESLFRAKMHVLQNYLVVGYLEDFTGMLQVLEKILPTFFEGGVDLWKKISKNSMNHTSTLKKIGINETARMVLRERMKFEYDFYNFVKVHFKVLKKRMGIRDMEII